MNKGWLELESDPGLFTLLVEDFGVQGVQVEEIYDLQKSMEGPVYGFIFLFRWIEERRARRKIAHEDDGCVVDSNIIDSMFFAHQIISNSCATHALLSVLLNCEDKLKLGNMLTSLKQFTKNMSPEDKGYAIGNMPDLARAHNSHARTEPYRLPEKQQGVSAGRIQEAFHFVSYVLINGHLFELDGLKQFPIDHGPCEESEDWTEKFRRVISERLGMATGGEPYHDIRFNLMAVVPDRRQQYEQKLKTLKTNRTIITEALLQCVKVSIQDPPTLSSNSTKYKPEPIRTRSARARERAAASTSRADAASDTGSTRHRNKFKSTDATSDTSSPRTPVFTIDSHGYARSPTTASSDDTETTGKIEPTDDKFSNISEESMRMDLYGLRAKHLETVADSKVKIRISIGDDGGGGLISNPTTLAATDVTRPLVIQTKFGSVSPGPCSGGSSTDTASEVASLLNSPAESLVDVDGDSSTTRDEQLPKTETDRRFSLTGESKTFKREAFDFSDEKYSSSVGDEKKAMLESACKSEKESAVSPQQAFKPKDLLSLLKNVESEISICEGNLRDEVDKRKKYKIDDCRRTHNYDQFICTFLSMLAEQGQLASLVQQHMLTKRRQGVSVGRLHKMRKTEKKKRGGGAKRKR